MGKVQVFKKKDGPDKALEIRRCGPVDLRDICALQMKVWRGIMDRNRFVVTEEGDILESLERDVCFGVYDGDKLVAFSILLTPRPTWRNLARDLGYPEDQELLCAVLDGAFVDPDYRGYGLQCRLISEREKFAREYQSREILTCTAPTNAACLTNLNRRGFQIVARRELFGGVDRYILSKPVEY